MAAEPELPAIPAEPGERPGVAVRATSTATRLRESAEGVQVIELLGAQRRTADLGDT